MSDLNAHFSQQADKAYQEAAAGLGMHDPDWGPLEKALPKEEHGGWMFMGYMPKGHGRGEGMIREYKHGITRKNLALDEHATPYEPRDTATFGRVYNKYMSASAVDVLKHKGHYKDLKRMGEQPGTPYNEDYQAKRNAGLREAGYDVLHPGP